MPGFCTPWRIFSLPIQHIFLSPFHAFAARHDHISTTASPPLTPGLHRFPISPTFSLLGLPSSSSPLFPASPLLPYAITARSRRGTPSPSLAYRRDVNGRFIWDILTVTHSAFAPWPRRQLERRQDDRLLVAEICFPPRARCRYAGRQLPFCGRTRTAYRVQRVRRIRWRAAALLRASPPPPTFATRHVRRNTPYPCSLPTASRSAWASC